MPDLSPTPTLYGGTDPAYLPGQSHLADLERAVVLGGEGGTLTLLGPHAGPGEFRPMWLTRETTDEEGQPITVNCALEGFGIDLIAALDRLQPAWRHMLGVHVAPQWEAPLRAELERFGRPYDQWRHPSVDTPLRCTAAWPACPAWPDGQVQDGYWLEGNLDQVRALTGRLHFAHQVQLQTSPCAAFGVLVSRDAVHRIALDPEYPHSQMWSVSPFIEVKPFTVTGASQVELATQLADHSPLGPQSINTGPLDQLRALPWEQFVGMARQVMETFGVDVDEEDLDDPVIHLSGFLNLGHETGRQVLPLLLSAHVEQQPALLTAETVERLRARLHPGMPGLVITTGDFSQDAEQASHDAPAPPIGLIDGTLLTELVEKFNLLPRHQEE